jgi:hypothetical protein
LFNRGVLGLAGRDRMRLNGETRIQEIAFFSPERPFYLVQVWDKNARRTGHWVVGKHALKYYAVQDERIRGKWVTIHVASSKERACIWLAREANRL